MYHITVLHTITSLCSIPLLSEGGALCTLLFSAENSMPRTTLLKHFLFIYLLFNSIMQYPTLLEHYASQRIFLAIRVHSHIILSIKNKKYTASRFTAEFLLTGNSIPRSSVTICTGILSHYKFTTLLPTGNSTPYTALLLPESEFTTYSVQFLLLAETQYTVHS